MRLVPRFVAAAAVVALLAGPATAGQEFGEVQASNASIGFDLIVLRPMGLIGLAMGSVLWVPAAAMAAAVQPSEVGKPTEHLILKPYRYVFEDPIGSH